MVKFIHAADLHLDSPFKGLHEMPEKLLKEVRQSTFKALEKLTKIAIEEAVDFVLISGDIYDLEDRSIKAQVAFRHEMEKLNDQRILVFLIHGNHDYMNGESNQLSMPENVYVFGPDPETTDIRIQSGEKVALSGFSYNERWVKDRKINDYPQRMPDVDWHIGLLHGFSESSQSTHGKYAPFSLGDLKGKGYDYWALGHIHQRQKKKKKPLIYYSGNTQGRHKNEPGEKGFLLVELNETKKEVSFVAAQSIRWEKLNVDASTANSLSDIYTLIEESIEDIQLDQTHYIVTMDLLLPAELDESLRRKLHGKDLLRSFQLKQKNNYFLWLNEIKLTYKNEDTQHSIGQMYEKEWVHVMEKMTEETELTAILEDFFPNAPSMDMLPLHQEAFREKILDEAIQLIHTTTKGEDG